MTVLFIVLSFPTLTPRKTGINLFLTAILKNNGRASFHQFGIFTRSWDLCLLYLLLSCFSFGVLKAADVLKKESRHEAKRDFQTLELKLWVELVLDSQHCLFLYPHTSISWSIRFLAPLSLPFYVITQLKCTAHTDLEIQIYCLECFDLGLYLIDDFAAL